MLPPGHIAAGYVVSKAVLSYLNYSLTSEQTTTLTLLGIFIAFVPDLDFFYAFFKTKSLRIDNQKVSHRTFITHAPILWLIAGLLTFFFAASPFYKALGLLIWLCSWTHFILDSEWGVMWAWPFNKKLYPLSDSYYQRKYAGDKKDQSVNVAGFWKYWWSVAKREYFTRNGYLEIILIVIALILIAK
ncbi:MAG: hypothetical protein JWO40_619 [Candidatus Doudnabacteria bacterium]|nr:hypothetical protein [Candidatus Doudnabacteria bacterium]